MIELVCNNCGAMVGVPDDALLSPSCPACGNNAMRRASLLKVIKRRLKAAWHVLRHGMDDQ